MKHESPMEQIMLALTLGFKPTHISYDVASNHSWVHQVRTGGSITPAKERLLNLALRNRARRCSRVKPSQRSILNCIESTGIRQRFLAEKLNVSKQYVNYLLNCKNPPKERLSELVSILREVGKQLESSL